MACLLRARGLKFILRGLMEGNILLIDLKIAVIVVVLLSMSQCPPSSCPDFHGILLSHLE
jgi:hypothetical protein